MALRIIFMGTPDFSVATLKALHAAGHQIVMAYSQPPRPGGRRGLDLQKSPVHLAAEDLGIEVRHPLNFRDPADREAFAALEADVAVVVPITAMPRFCRAGGEPPPSSAPSWPAMPRRA